MNQETLEIIDNWRAYFRQQCKKLGAYCFAGGVFVGVVIGEVIKRVW